jgi:hypothetical protein
MIRNARVHIEGALPVVVDLQTLPGPADVSLLCTNMRTTDGKRPTFIEHSESWFVIPMSVVRFVEMPADALEQAAASALPSSVALGPGATAAGSTGQEDADFEPDEAFLQRIRDI